MVPCRPLWILHVFLGVKGFFLTGHAHRAAQPAPWPATGTSRRAGSNRPAIGVFQTNKQTNKQAPIRDGLYSLN